MPLFLSSELCVCVWLFFSLVIDKYPKIINHTMNVVKLKGGEYQSSENHLKCVIQQCIRLSRFH